MLLQNCKKHYGRCLIKSKSNREVAKNSDIEENTNKITANEEYNTDMDRV